MGVFVVGGGENWNHLLGWSTYPLGLWFRVGSLGMDAAQCYGSYNYVESCCLQLPPMEENRSYSLVVRTPDFDSKSFRNLRFDPGYDLLIFCDINFSCFCLALFFFFLSWSHLRILSPVLYPELMHVYIQPWDGPRQDMKPGVCMQLIERGVRRMECTPRLVLLTCMHMRLG